MKKRLKGLLALCLAVCTVLAGLPAAEVQAEETVSGNSAERMITVDGSGELFYGSEKVTELFPGDELQDNFTGGFVVLKSNTEGEMLAETDKLAYYFDEYNNEYYQDPYYKYFDVNEGTSFVVPDKPGYTYTFEKSADTYNDKEYVTKISAPGEEKSPVKFLYIKVEPITYTVVFDANGGTGTMDPMTFKYDAVQELTKNTFTKDGYKFAGWNTAADRSGTSYADKTNMSNMSTIDGDTITLYAMWDKTSLSSPQLPIAPPESDPAPTPAPEPEAEAEEIEEEVEEEAAEPIVTTAPAKTSDHSDAGIMLTMLMLAGCAVLILRRKMYQK